MLGLCICLFSRHISRNAVVSGKSPFYFSGSHSSEADGIANRPPRSLYYKNKRRQTDKPSTETLAAHAHAGVVGLFRSTCVRDTPCRTVTCVSTRK